MNNLQEDGRQAVRDVVEAVHNAHGRANSRERPADANVPPNNAPPPNANVPPAAPDPGRPAGNAPAAANLPRDPRPGNPADRPGLEEQRAVGAFKVPPLDLGRVDRFFMLAEDRFLALGIYHPNLRYSCVMEYLPPQLLELVAARHEEISASPDRYLALKTAVLAYTYRPYWARMQALDALPNVGTMSPTQLLCKILALKTVGEPFTDSLRYQFLKRLPGPLYEKYKNKDWDQADPMQFAVRVEADWSPHQAGPSSAPASTSMPPSAANSGPPGAVAVAQVDEAEAEANPAIDAFWRPMVAAFQASRRGSNQGGRGRGNRQGRGQNRGGGNSFNRPPAQQGASSGNSRAPAAPGRTSNENWCYFHQRFGRDAYSCRPPCTYDQRVAGGMNDDRQRQGSGNQY